MSAVVVLTTTPNPKIAASIARGLVKEKLAACVSFHSGWHSFYRWKGRITSAREAILLIKTPKKKFSEVKRFIQSRHPYDVPEIVAIPIIQGSSEYLQWLLDETQGLNKGS